MKELELVKYNNEEEQNLFLDNLKQDEEVKKYACSVNFKNEDSSFILSVDNTYIGALNINKEYNNSYSIDIAIEKQYRNMGYCVQAFTMIKEIFLNDINFRILLIRTDYQNENITKACKKAGFFFDQDEYEKTIEEGCTYLVYSITNKEYKMAKTI